MRAAEALSVAVLLAAAAAAPASKLHPCCHSSDHGWRNIGRMARKTVVCLPLRQPHRRLAASWSADAVLNSGGVTAMSLRGPVLNALGQPLLTPSNYSALGRAVFYEIPVRPVATLALFHGCAHDASDFWPRAACAACDGEGGLTQQRVCRAPMKLLTHAQPLYALPRPALSRPVRQQLLRGPPAPCFQPKPRVLPSTTAGLPEEVAHTKQALARGYAVVAIDASEPSRCFGIHADQAAVLTILTAFLRRPYQGNQTLQVRGYGASALVVRGMQRLVRVMLRGWCAMLQNTTAWHAAASLHSAMLNLFSSVHGPPIPPTGAAPVPGRRVLRCSVCPEAAHGAGAAGGWRDLRRVLLLLLLCCRSGPIVPQTVPAHCRRIPGRCEFGVQELDVTLRAVLFTPSF